MQRVLFVCTHNSARSQMAEGLLRHFAGHRFEAFSAGTEPGAVNPLAVRAMAEISIDIGGQHSKSVDEFTGQAFGCVITVCDQAREACPVIPGAARQLHWSLEDPSRAGGSERDRLAAFTRVRDGIRTHIQQFISEQASEESGGSRTWEHR